LNFVQTGGTALAAVELPETLFPNTDYSSAFFDVSVNQALTPEQCGEFSVPASKPTAESAPATDASAQSAAVSAASPASSAATALAATSSLELPGTKLMLGDMELHRTEAVSGEGTRQSDVKYFHTFQNGACYEFALNVTTVAREQDGRKHVDRDKVFDRLEKIMATVKINPVAVASAPAAETTASMPTTPATPETPRQ
jgi:hypothetical protein